MIPKSTVTRTSMALLTGWLFVASTLMLGRPADAQDAAIRRLIGSAVAEADIGPQYADVGKAIVRFTNRDFEGAESLLKNVRNEHPELPPVGIMMGQLFAAANDAASSRTYLERAVRDNPEDPEAYVLFGDSALQQRFFTDADLLYARANQHCEKLTGNRKRKKDLTARALSGLSLVAEAREDWAAAEKHLTAVTTTETENTNLRTRLGRALFKQGKDKEAYQVFQDLYNFDKEKIARPEVSMARLYQQDGKDQQAEKLIKLALERDPKSVNTQMAAAQWALEAGDLDVARTALAAAKQLDPKDANVNLLDGVLLRYDEKFGEAAEAFSQAHLKSPGNLNVISNLSLVLSELGDEESQNRALEFGQLNLRMAGDNQQQAREATVALAYVMYKSGRTVEAEQALQRAIQGATTLSADGAYYAAVMLSESGRNDPAKQLLAPILKKPQFFSNRKRAERLMTSLNGG